MIKRLKRSSQFSGTVAVPPDKSLTHRAIFFSSLANGVSTIENPLMAEDCLSTAACMEALGVRIDRKPGRWSIEGAGLWGFKPPKEPLNCGNSGTTMRLMSGILSAQDFSTQLEGDASLSKRPMNRVADPLTKMGAVFNLRDGKYAPFQIAGTKKIRPLQWKNNVASAQVKSAVLLAALHANGETVYDEPIVSRDHTERMLLSCGVPIRREGTTIKLTGPAPLNSQNWIIPSDISSAAFFLVGGLIIPGARVHLSAINTNPTRTGILDVIKAAGANVSIVNKRTVGGEPIADLVIDKQIDFGPLRIDAAISPRLIDEIPILAVAAAFGHGRSEFSGLEELRFKETDRLKAIATNLRAMGGDVEEKQDGLVIVGPTVLHGAEIDSFDDHRIAMAFAIAAVTADGTTTIRGSECVSISFPTFWTLLDQLCGI